MSPYYNTRSAARRKAAETSNNTPSDPPSRPESPDEERSWRSPSLCPTDLSDSEATEQAMAFLEDPSYIEQERRIMEREMARLEGQKIFITSMMEEEAIAHQQRTINQPYPNRPANASVMSGPKLPAGVSRLGPNGTWVSDGFWRPDPVISTTELPTIRQPWEEEEVVVQVQVQAQAQVQDLPVPLSDVTQDGRYRDPRFRMLTPLRSFVTGDGSMQAA